MTYRSVLLMLFFAPLAIADEIAAGPSMIGQFVMIGVFIGIFYFMILRPQNKKAKEHREMISKLSKGDEIITSGGLLVKVSKTTDNFLVVELTENTEVTIKRDAVASVLPKGTLKNI